MPGSSLVAPLRQSMADFTESSVRAALAALLRPGAVVRLCHPLGTVTGDAFYDVASAPLLRAMPDLERRDQILLSG